MTKPLALWRQPMAKPVADRLFRRCSVPARKGNGYYLRRPCTLREN
jgi:hypothetical protein